MVVFRIIKNLIKLTIRSLWLPIVLFKRYTFIVILIVAALYIRHQFASHDSSLAQLTPAPTQEKATTAKPNSTARKTAAASLVQPVLKKEDGDSNFATDLYATMTEEERAIYSGQFFWAMSNVPSGQTHQWTGGNIAGSIRPNDSFSNSQGDRCRHFSEALKVHTIQQTLSGTACERGGGAWCKLKPNATPLCGLGHQPGMWEGMKRSLGL